MTLERLDEDPQQRAVAELLRELPRRAPSAGSRLETEWREIELRAAGRSRTPMLRYALAAMVSAAVGSAITFWVMSPAPRAPEALAWQLKGPATVALLGPNALRLEAGRLEGVPSAKLARVQTPFGDSAWTNARFLLETTRERLLLSVESGEVEWRDARGTQRVVKGQTLEMPPAALVVPEQLRSAAVVSEECGGDHACLAARAAAVTGLDAENALFELAALEREQPGQLVAALEHLREYQRRFPRGVFEAEVSVSAIVTLAQLGHRSEALAEAARFRREHPADLLLGPVDALTRQLDEGRRP